MMMDSSGRVSNRTLRPVDPHPGVRSRPSLRLPITLYIACASLILAVHFIPARAETVFSPWSAINGWNYVRMAASLLLIGLIPGQLLMRVAALKMGFRLSALEAVVPAFLISIFVSAFLQWLMLRIGLALKWHGDVFVAVWSALLIAALVTEVRFAPRRTGNEDDRVSRPGLAAVTSVILVSLIVAVSLNFIDRFLFFDAPVNISGALSILREGRPLEEDHYLQRTIGAGLWYPSWFRILLASLFLTSGFPPINGAHIFDLFFLKMVPVVAFYVMVRSFARGRDERVPSIATVVFFLFSGFVWLSALKSGVLRDLVVSAVVNQPITLFQALDTISKQNAFVAQYPPYTQLIHAVTPQPIGLGSLFLLLALSNERTLPSRVKAALVFIAAFVGFAFHEVEIILFLVILYAPLRVFVRDLPERGLLLPILGALLAVLLLDLLSPASFFVQRIEFWVALLAAVALFVGRGALVHAAVSARRLLEQATTTGLVRLLAGGLFLLYGLSLVFWFRIPSRDSSWKFVPPVYYPVAFGIAGFLAVLEFAYLARRRELARSYEGFFILFTLGSLIAARIGPHLSPQVHEYRLLIYPFIGMAVLSAAWLVRTTSELWSNSQRKGARGLVSLLVSLVLVSGISGTAWDVTYWRLSNAHLPYEDLVAETGAIDYLRRNRPSNTDVATVNWRSRISVIYSGSEHNWLADVEPLFAEQDPLATLHFLSNQSIRTIYLTPGDFKDLDAWGYEQSFLMRHLIRYLPISYESPYAAIYSVPPLAAPTTSGDSALIIPSSDYLLDAVALAGIRYSAYVPADRRQFQSATIVMDDFSDIRLPITDPRRWSRRWQTGLTVTEGEVLLLFEAEVPYRAQMWASYEFPDVSHTGDLHLCVRYQTSPLPRGSNYYYLELQDAQFQKVFSSVLPTSDARQSNVCYALPGGIRPSRAILAVDTGTAGPMRARLQLQEIRLVAGQHSVWDPWLERLDLNSYLAWVKNGGRLIAVGDGTGLFAGPLSLKLASTVEADGIQGVGSAMPMIQLKVPGVVSTDSGTKVVASYALGGKAVAALGFSKRIGRGEIVYLVLSPIFSAMRQEAGNTKGRQLFVALGDLWDRVLPGLPKQGPMPPPSLYMVASDVRLSGEIRVTSQVPPIAPAGDLKVAQLVLKAGNASQNGSTVDAGTLADVAIERLEVSAPSVSALTSQLVRLHPTGRGDYSSLGVDLPFDWLLTSKGQIRITGTLRGKRLELVVRNGSVAMNGITSRSGRMLVYKPEVAVQGKAEFGYATIWTKDPHGGLVWRSRASLEGAVGFQVEVSGKYLHMVKTTLKGRLRAERINEWWDTANYSRTVDFSQPSEKHEGRTQSVWRVVGRVLRRLEVPSH